jgi:hypothetical protein
MANTTRNRLTGADIEVGTSQELGLDSYYGKWAVRCLTHDVYVYATRRSGALEARAYPDFCPQCSAKLPPKSQVK